MSREPEVEYVEYLSSQATTYCKHMVDDDLLAKSISYKQSDLGMLRNSVYDVSGSK
jgi:hypothetical protein